ncbi:MAG TPA: MFS transporter [Sphingomonas sp.]|jgi:MFS family permease
MATVTAAAGWTSRGSIDAWPSSRAAWTAVALLNLSYLLAFADRIILSLLAVPIQADLGISDTQLGLLTGVAFGLCYTLCGLPAGFVADRVNRRSFVAAGLVTWSLMTAACGLATTFLGLFLARIGVGVGEAVLHPSATSLIADYFPPERRARAYATYMMAGAAGTFFAFLLGGQLLAALGALGPVHWPLVGVFQPWQATFVVMAAPGIVLAAVIMLIMREPVRRDTRGVGDKPLPGEVRRLLASERRMFACLMLGIPLLLVGSYGLVSWLPVIFQRVHGWAPGATAVRFAMTAGIAGIVGTLALGRMVEFLRERGHADATFLMCLGGGIAVNLFVALAMLAPDPWTALALITVAAFFLLAPGIAAVSCIAEIAPNRLRAQVSALFTLMAGLITNTAGPFLVGLIGDRVLGDPARINIALLIVVAVCGTAGAILIGFGLAPYRRVVEPMLVPTTR